jgi:putative membrane protein insertion efficiency factor
MLRIFFICAIIMSVLIGQAPASEEDYSYSYSPASLSIRFYQKYISDLHYGHCRFKPSCSHYALEACNKYGTLKGAILTTDRLIRCNKGAKNFYPATSDGRLSDPVAVFKTRKQLLTPMWLLPVEERPSSTIERLESTEMSNDRSENTEYPKGAITISEYIAFADNLALEGDCERAITVYKLVSFLVGTDDVTRWSKMKSGECYYKLEQWDNAAGEFLEAVRFSQEGIERDNNLFMAAASRFNAQSYNNCKTILDQSSVDHSRSYERTNFLRGLSFMAQGDWDAGIAELEDIEANYNNSPLAGRALFLAEKAENADAIPSRNPTLAMILSSVVPGLGQVYSGRASDGLRHFIFNGLLGYGVYKLIADENYTGAYLLAGVTLPFYAGNIAGAKRSSQDYTRSRRTGAISKWINEADGLGTFE